MKTKLLKKIRKRYSIILYTEIKDPNSWLYKVETPFYRVIDKDDLANTKLFYTYEEAYCYLRKLIRLEYYSSIKRNRGDKGQKVWYNKINKYHDRRIYKRFCR